VSSTWRGTLCDLLVGSETWWLDLLVSLSYNKYSLAPRCYIEPFSRVVRPRGTWQQQQQYHVTTPHPQEELASFSKRVT
jgi:hypothetical protein